MGYLKIFKTIDVLESEELMMQGVATDGTYIYCSYATASSGKASRIEKRTMDGELLEEKDYEELDTDPWYLNDIACYNGKLYGAVMNFPVSPKASKIVVFNSTTLEIESEYPLPDARWVESLEFYEGYWWIVYGDIAKRYITKFTTAFVKVADYPLNFPITGWDGGTHQGICWIGNDILVNMHSGGDPIIDPKKVDHYHYDGLKFIEVERLERPVTSFYQGLAYLDSPLYPKSILCALRHGGGYGKHQVCFTKYYGLLGSTAGMKRVLLIIPDDISYDEMLTLSLEEANAYVNNYLSEHTSTPLISAPDELHRITEVIASCFFRRRYMPKEGGFDEWWNEGNTRLETYTKKTYKKGTVLFGS